MSDSPLDPSEEIPPWKPGSPSWGPLPSPPKPPGWLRPEDIKQYEDGKRIVDDERKRRERDIRFRDAIKGNLNGYADVDNKPTESAELQRLKADLVEARRNMCKLCEFYNKQPSGKEVFIVQNAYSHYPDAWERVQTGQTYLKVIDFFQGITREESVESLPRQSLNNRFFSCCGFGDKWTKLQPADYGDLKVRADRVKTQGSLDLADEQAVCPFDNIWDIVDYEIKSKIQAIRKAERDKKRQELETIKAPRETACNNCNLLQTNKKGEKICTQATSNNPVLLKASSNTDQLPEGGWVDPAATCPLGQWA